MKCYLKCLIGYVHALLLLGKVAIICSIVSKLTMNVVQRAAVEYTRVDRVLLDRDSTHGVLEVFVRLDLFFMQLTD